MVAEQKHKGVGVYYTAGTLLGLHHALVYIGARVTHANPGGTTNNLMSPLFICPHLLPASLRFISSRRPGFLAMLAPLVMGCSTSYVDTYTILLLSTTTARRGIEETMPVPLSLSTLI